MTVQVYQPSTQEIQHDEKWCAVVTGIVFMAFALCACSVAVGMIGVGVLSGENCRPSRSYSSSAFGIGSVIAFLPTLCIAFAGARRELDELCPSPAIRGQRIAEDKSLFSTYGAIGNVILFNSKNFKDILVFTATYIFFLGGVVVGCITAPKDDEIPSCRSAVFLEFYPLLQHVAGMATLLAFTGTMRGLQYACARVGDEVRTFQSRTNVTDFNGNRLPASPTSFC